MKLALVILYGCLLCSVALAEEYRVEDSDSNSVKFFARASLGNFTGKTGQISGFITWEGEDTLSTSQVYFEVDLASLDTGIGLRNKHMREKYLQTDTYPKAVYEGKLLQWILQPDSTYLVKTEGMLTIHGVERPFSTIGKLVKKGETYQIYLNFNLNVTDFDIKKPRFLLSSMNEVVALQLNIVLRLKAG